MANVKKSKSNVQLSTAYTLQLVVTNLIEQVKEGWADRPFYFDDLTDSVESQLQALVDSSKQKRAKELKVNEKRRIANKPF